MPEYPQKKPCTVPGCHIPYQHTHVSALRGTSRPGVVLKLSDVRAPKPSKGAVVSSAAVKVTANATGAITAQAPAKP